MLEDAPTTPAVSIASPTSHAVRLEVVAYDRIELSPTNPRTHLDRQSLDELKASIHETPTGLLQPVTLRPRPSGNFELVAGWRRYSAMRELQTEHPTDARYAAGLRALIYDVDDASMPIVQLVENLHRADLSPIEIATSVATTLESMSPDDLCRQLGWSARNLRRYEQLHRAPNYLQDLARFVEVVETVTGPDGSTEKKTVRKPGFDFTFLIELIAVHNKLRKWDGERQKEDGSHKPVAERLSLRLAQRAASDSWSLSTLKREAAALFAKATGERSNTSAARAAPPKRVFHRAGDRLTLDISARDAVTAEDRTNIARELTEALKALGFSTVILNP